MYFPKMYEIATEDVITVDSKTYLKDTIKILKESNHRSIVVTNDGDYHLFSASDLIKVKLNDENLNKILEDIPLIPIPQIHRESSVLDTMELVHSGVEYICIVNDDRSLYGLVTNSDIISSIDPQTLIENFTVKDYFKKIVDLNYISKDDSIHDAMEIMNSSNSDCVIIVEDEKPNGILTIKDTVSIFAKDISLDSKVKEFYSYPLETISDNFTIKEAIDFINEKHFKRVIATNEKGKITGILTQQELIAYSYNHWASLMKNYHNELLSLNRLLKEKSDKLQTMATTDTLTKLYNRHMFSEFFNKFLEKMRRKQEDGFILALLDIDNFKLINDTYGHNMGDEVLVSLSSFLVSQFRSSDIIARWGGEEFVILLTNTDIKKGFISIDKMRESFGLVNHKDIGVVTVSIGVTQVKENDTLQSAIDRADKALYKSKNSGKNKVTTSL